MRVQPELFELLKTQQLRDEKLAQILVDIEKFSHLGYTLRSDGILLFRGCICIPDDGKLKQEILNEAHKSRYTIHPGVAKIYHELKHQYWWSGMKKDVPNYVSQCLVCQQVKEEHQKPAGLLLPLAIPEWKWDNVAMDL